MKVRLHNNSDKAAKFTDKTIRGLPGYAELKKDINGNIVFDSDGLAEIIGNNLGLIKYAVIKQGYVKEVF